MWLVGMWSDGQCVDLGFHLLICGRRDQAPEHGGQALLPGEEPPTVPGVDALPLLENPAVALGVRDHPVWGLRNDEPDTRIVVAGLPSGPVRHGGPVSGLCRRARGTAGGRLAVGWATQGARKIGRW